MRRLAAAVLCALVVAACSSGGDRQAQGASERERDRDRRDAATARDAATTTATGDATANQTTTTGARADSATTTTERASNAGTGIHAPSGFPATSACPPIPARTAPAPDRAEYILQVDVDLANNVVTGTTDVRFTPDVDTDRLVFRLWPNGPRASRLGAKLEVTGVDLGHGGAAAVEQPDPTTLVVPLPGGLAAGRTVQANVDWRLTLPGAVEDRVSRTGDAVRLGSFHPILAWEPGVGWATDPPTGLFAESSVSPPADFTLRVTTPPGLTALASGAQVEPDRWIATAVPDVALSVGRFRRATAQANVGQAKPVDVVVGVHDTIGESPQTYAAKVVRALEDFSRRYGPYPWPTYTLAITPNLRGGIEYPMHVMQGPGTIGRTTSHEVAHMWFYGLVVNHQGRDPWLDEGLATFAEGRFEGTLDTFRRRSIPADAQRQLGQPMTYWEHHPSSYYRGIYVQGAQALAALGEASTVDCALHHYVARNAFRVARPSHLADALDDVFPHAVDTLAAYGADDLR